MLWLQQPVIPTWVGPTMAVSLVIIALAFVVIAAAAALAARHAATEVRHLSSVIESLREELHPAMAAVQQVSVEGSRLAGLIAGETEEVVQASRALRDGVRERVANLEAIYGVLEEELEETAVDVAVTLRNFRTGVGWFGVIRRLLRAGRRR